MGSPSDKTNCEIIQKHCQKLDLKVEMRISSAHKETADTLNVISEVMLTLRIIRMTL